MDPSVRAAMHKWPDVPAVYGWLSLDEHGRWRLRGEPITHAGLIAFINRNYGPDEAGRWFFQNGPQRGYVRLDYTPLVLHVDTAGRLQDHTGRPVTAIHGAWIDQDGDLLLETAAGPGLVASAALPRVSDWLVDAGRAPAAPERIEALLAGDTGGSVWLDSGGAHLPVGRIERAEVPHRFGFVAEPRPADAEAGPRPA